MLMKPPVEPAVITAFSRLLSLLVVLVLTVTGTACSTSSTVNPSSFVAGGPGLGDSFYPNFGNGGYDVQHYILEMSVDVGTSALQATSTIEAVATENLLNFNLDFIGFSIDQILVNDQPATFARDGQELTITPAVGLLAGKPFKAVVTYNGIPEQITSVAIPVLTGWVYFNGGNFVLSEPDGAANFYPVNDHPKDEARYTFRITVPKPYNVAANGVLEEVEDQGGSQTFVFEARDPMASYLVTINTGEFTLTQEAHNPPIRNFFPTALGTTYQEIFARQGEMLDFLASLFGPYPFELYGSVLVNTETGSALETQTLSIFGLDTVDPSDVPGSEQVVVHEAMHQWFGNDLTLADWSDIWLNEGLATYAEWLWIEHTQGLAAAEDYIGAIYGFVASESGIVPPGSPSPDDLFNTGVYYRGGLTLQALRKRIGDPLFFTFLQTYYQRFKGGYATTPDLIAVAEEVSGQNLADFFTAWLYETGLPPIPEMSLSPSLVQPPAPELRQKLLDRKLHPSRTS